MNIIEPNISEDSLKMKILKEALNYKWPALKEYASGIEGLIDSEKKRLKDWVNAKPKEFSIKDKTSFSEIYGDAFLKLQDMKSILRRSIFLFICAEFENSLKLLTRLCGCKIASQWRGNTFEKANNYFKSKSIKFPPNKKLENLWIEIRFFRQIRNALAHNNCFLKKTKSELIEYVKNNDEILYDGSKIIELEKEFLLNVIKKFEFFLMESFDYYSGKKDLNSSNNG